MKGAEAFADWLPDMLLDGLQRGANLSSPAVAQAVTVAMAATAFYVLVSMVAGLLAGMGDLVGGRTLVHRRSGLLGGLHRLAGFAVIAAPWYNVVRIPMDGVVAGDGVGEVVLAGLLWLCLGAVNRDALWLDLGDGMVRAQRGFAVFQRHTLALDLSKAFLGPGGHGIGQLDRLEGQRVVIAPAAIAALAPYHGGENRAAVYLQGVLTRAGGRLRH